MRKAILLAMLLLGLSASAAQAQEFVNAVCRSDVSLAGVHFDTAEHSRWYKRFWTGDCDHLALCFPGSPNWNDVVDKLLARGGPSERAVLLPKACRLGQLIGLEWSRDRGVRRISTADLRKLDAMLEASGDALRGVERVEAAARAKLQP